MWLPPTDIKTPKGGINFVNNTHPLARYLVGAWTLNEGSGVVSYDRSGNGNNFTNRATAPTWNAAGGRTFASNSDWIFLDREAPLLFGTGPYTAIVEFSSTNSAGSNHYIFGNLTNSRNYGFASRLNNGNVGIYIASGGSNTSADTTGCSFNDGFRHKIAITRRGTSCFLYVDGVLRITHTGSSGTVDDVGYTGFCLGHWGDEHDVPSDDAGDLPQYGFSGTIYSAYLFNTALSQQQVGKFGSCPAEIFANVDLLDIVNGVAAGATSTATSIVKAPTTAGVARKTKRATATSVVKAPTTAGVARKTKRTTATSVVKAPTTAGVARKTKRTTATSVVKAPTTAGVGRKTKRSTSTSVVKAPLSSGVGRKAKRASSTSKVNAPITTASGTITPAAVAGTVTAIATSIVKAPATIALCRLVRRCTATSTVKAPITSGNVRRNKRCTATSVAKAPITTGSATVSSHGLAPCSGTSVVAAPRTIASSRIAHHCVGTSVVNAPRTTGSVNGTAGTQLDRIEQLLYVLMAVKS